MKSVHRDVCTCTEPHRVHTRNVRPTPAPRVKCKTSIQVFQRFRSAWPSIPADWLCISSLFSRPCYVCMRYNLKSADFLAIFCLILGKSRKRIADAIYVIGFQSGICESAARQNYITEFYNLYCLPNMVRWNKWKVI